MATVSQQRRLAALWLPWFAAERIDRRYHGGGGPSGPLVTHGAGRRGLYVRAVNRAAAAVGLAPGMTLADARARVPGLLAHAADPLGDARALAGLVRWGGRYTPLAAPWSFAGDGLNGHGPNGLDGLWLDIGGSAHLFGGEAALLADAHARLARFGFTARGAIADTAGAAWAMARFGAGGVLPSGAAREMLAPLPMAALRLAPATAEALSGVGLRRIGDLYGQARAGLARRFGAALLRRLDQALGTTDEPLSPPPQPAPLLARMAFAEPVGHMADIEAAARALLDDLCAQLARAGLGAGRVVLRLRHAGGGATEITAATGRPSRSPGHLMALLEGRIAGFAPGFGIDAITAHARMTAPLAATQAALLTGGEARDEEDTGRLVDRLIDRLANRLGPRRVRRLAAHASHIPERAWRAVPATDKKLPPQPPAPTAPRPPRLLACPEPLTVITPAPGAPPAVIRWRGQLRRIVRADGPERIGPEWWRLEIGGQTETRDYYRLEDADGRRLWVFRQIARTAAGAPRWYLHGVFP